MSKATSSAAGAGGRLGPRTDNPPGGIDAGLGLAGAGRGAPTQPGQFPPGQVATGGFCLGGAVRPLGCRGQVAGVATLVHIRTAPVQLEHAGGDPVEKMTVVADEHHPAGETGQPRLQPGDRGQVEMVGGLVEDQQLRRVGQDPGQRHPLGLPAGEVRDTTVDQTAHAQPVQDRLGLPARADRLADGALRNSSLLVQQADPDTPAPANLAGFGGLDASQNPQQGRLAGPVDTDHTEPVPVGHRDRQLLEENPIGAPHRHTGCIDEDGHRSDSRARTRPIGPLERSSAYPGTTDAIRSGQLDQVSAAFVDPTRRAIVRRLA